MSKIKKYRSVKCENPECGKIFKILDKTYYERRRLNRDMFCPDCMRISTSKKLSEANKAYQVRVTSEEKKAHYDKISESSKLSWSKKTEEEMKQFSEN